MLKLIETEVALDGFAGCGLCGDQYASFGSVTTTIKKLFLCLVKLAHFMA